MSTANHIDDIHCFQLRLVRAQEMRRESIEEGQEAQPFLNGQPCNRDSRSRDEDAGDSGTTGSRVTAVLLLCTFTVACGSFSMGYVIGYSSPAEYEIMEDLGLTVAEYSVFGSMYALGVTIGAAVSGWITDLIGRRRTIWILDIFYMTGWLVIAFAKVAWVLDFGRLLLGFGTAIALFLAPVYIAEIAPKNLRGAIFYLTQFVLCCSVSFVFVVGSMINWRILALIGVVPCLLQLILAFFIPESPRWLAKIGNENELEAALSLLRGDKADISQEAAEIKDYTEAMESISKGSLLDMFQRKYALSSTIGIGVMALQHLAGCNAYILYTSAIFVSTGVPTTMGLVAAAVFQILAFGLAIILMDKAGRRPLILVSFSGMCLGSFLTGLSLLLQDIWGKEVTAMLALISVLVYFGSYALGSGIPWILVSEIFPMNIKGSAGSICNLTSGLFALLVTYSFQFLLEWIPAGIFFIFASFSGLAVLFVAKLVPETKGRTLEEIQASINQSQL